MAFFAVSKALGAPFPYPLTEALELLTQSPGAGLNALWSIIRVNLGNFWGVFDDNPLLIVMRLQLLIVLGFGCFFWWRHRHHEQIRREMLVYISLTGLILLIINVLYEVVYWRDYRPFAMFLLVGALLLAAFRRYKIVAVLILLNVVVLAAFMLRIKERTISDFTHAPQHITAFAEATADALAYDPAVLPWCNTLLFPLDDVGFYGERWQELLGVPPGIGLSIIFNHSQLGSDLQSKYLWLGEDYARIMAEKVDLQPLLTTENATLYQNMDADCP